MSTAEDRRASLVRLLLDEASDVDLVCYLARSGGDALLRDLLESIRDIEFLSTEDLLYNINLLREKKAEASSYPMHSVFQRLMNPPGREPAIAINGVPPSENGKLNFAQH